MCLSSTLFWRRCSSPDIYVKVALFEGKRVLKAKKTRMLACEDLLEFQVLAALQSPTVLVESPALVTCTAYIN